MDQTQQKVNTVTMTEKKKILIVDDEPSWRDLLSFELSSEGYDVATASMATEGLVHLRQFQVDLLITDVRMPGELDGIDMVKIYRKEKPYLKVIFITGYAVEEKLQEALGQQLTVVLRKPFNMDDLLKKVRNFLT